VLVISVTNSVSGFNIFLNQIDHLEGLSLPRLKEKEAKSCGRWMASRTFVTE